MALWSHQREGLVIGVEHQHSRGELHTSRHRQVEQRDLAGGNAGQRPIEAATRWPELREVFLPRFDDFCRLDSSTAEANAVRFLPHGTKTLQRSYGTPSLHIQIERSSWHARNLQRSNLLRPVGGISCFLTVAELVPV